MYSWFHGGYRGTAKQWMDGGAHIGVQLSSPEHPSIGIRFDWDELVWSGSVGGQ